LIFCRYFHTFLQILKSGFLWYDTVDEETEPSTQLMMSLLRWNAGFIVLTTLEIIARFSSAPVG